MNIDTTLNLRIDQLNKMIRIKQELNLSLNKIVHLLLLKALNWKNKSLKTFQSVKYQSKKQNIDFHKLHVSLDRVLYEQCMDMRKLYKLSVSYILTICIQKYIEKNIGELLKYNDTDNYHNCYMLITNNNCNEAYSFTIFWNLPDKIPFG